MYSFIATLEIVAVLLVAESFSVCSSAIREVYDLFLVRYPSFPMDCPVPKLTVSVLYVSDVDVKQLLCTHIISDFTTQA